MSVSLQLVYLSSVAKQRAVLGAGALPAEGEGAGGGRVSPASLCVLIEVVLPLKPPVLPPPCCLEEVEWGGGVDLTEFEGRVAYQALLPLA